MGTRPGDKKKGETKDLRWSTRETWVPPGPGQSDIFDVLEPEELEDGQISLKFE